MMLYAVLLLAAVLGAQTYEEHALRISRDIQARHVPFGTILGPVYESPSSQTIVSYSRCGDSAIWTGHWLAAEAFRYRVTGSAEALDAVRRAMRGVQLLVDVTGENHLLARCALRVDSPLSAGPRNEERHHGEYTGRFEGTDYYWIGNTSRDQYMGVFFGLSVAFEHVPETRTLARDLATRLIERLRSKNWAVVMPNGNISTVFWLRPDQQLAILQVGRQVNPERFAQAYTDARRWAIGLNTIMSLESGDPHDSYFKFNLAAITFYNLIRLEEPQSTKRDDYLEAYSIFRRTVASHGNAFFNIIDRALTGADVRRDAETQELLAAWLLRPRRDFYVDLRGKYRACGDDRACDPIPVSERVRTDFLWQRSPFLLYGGGEGKIESPGIDFILPYWMGRYYGLDFNLMAVSAASGASRIAPDSIATLYGSGFGSAPQVEVRDAMGIVRAAVVIFSNARQINFIVPSGVAPGSVRVATGAYATVVDVQAVAPAVFSANASGRGVAAAIAIRVDAGGQRVTVPFFQCTGLLCIPREIDISSSPVYVSLFGTGIRHARDVQVLIDDEPVPVLYFGAQSEFAGLDQVNIRLDPTVRTRGERNVTVVADGLRSNPVRILLK